MDLMKIFSKRINVLKKQISRKDRTSIKHPKKITRETLIILSLFIIPCMLTAGPSKSPQIEKDPTIITRAIDELKSKIPAWHEETDIPGMAIAVMDDEKIHWQQVYGHISRNKAKPITPVTIFSIQSMSKSFTALGVLFAVQDGLLDLDEPITTYLPDFTVNSIYEEHPQQKMTLRLLLAHRAGFTHEAPLGSNFDCRPHTFEEHVLSISDSWLRYPVGYRYSYSNLGIDLAGYILQKKAGMPFWEYIKRKVLDPLGMTSTTLNFDEIKKTKNRAIGHVAPQVDIPDGIPVDIPMIPAGGVYTNIPDMAKYLQFHINKGRINGKQILREDLIEEMHSVQFPERRQKAGYCLCLNKSFVSGTYFLHHGGGGYGFITSMTMYPELRIGVVTLTNLNHSRIHGGRIQEVINTLIEEKFCPTQVLPQKFDESAYTPINPNDERVKKIMGLYEINTKIGYKNEEFGIALGRDFYPLKMFLAKDGLVGTFGQFSELRFKPFIDGRPGTIVTLHRKSGDCCFYDFHKPADSQDMPGPNKREWQRYLGFYGMLTWGRMRGSGVSVTIKEGYLTWNGARCHEYLPGLFFNYNGEALDFRGTIPTARNIMLIKRR
jgi:CubicO group peptidase (beta-lactamase class C family)